MKIGRNQEPKVSRASWNGGVAPRSRKVPHQRDAEQYDDAGDDELRSARRGLRRLRRQRRSRPARRPRWHRPRSRLGWASGSARGRKIGSLRSAKQSATAVVVLAAVASRVGTQIASGIAEPMLARIPITPSGKSETLVALMARKSTIASLALAGVRLIFCNSVIAFRPKGVAALPSPSTFDARFMIIAPIAG